MRSTFAALPLALSAAFATPNVWAEADQTMNAVVVSASRSDTKLQDMPLHTTVVSREAIERSPAQTLDQLLRNVPGMNFSGVPAAISDPTGQQTRMRGMGNAKVLVLLDGVPIHDPFYLTTQWYKVPLSNIERVEVIRGGNSSLWGNMATAGVVNIVSRRATNNAGELTVSFGTQGTSNIALSKNFTVSDTLSVNVALDSYHTDGYQTTPKEYLWRFPQKGTPQADNLNAQITAYFKPSADLNGYLRLGHHVQDQDQGYRYNNNKQETPDISGGFTYRLDKDATVAANAWAQYVRFEKYNGNSCYFVAASDCRNSASANLNVANTTRPVVQFYSQYGSQRYREHGGSVTYSKTLAGRRSDFQIGADYRHLSATDVERFYGSPISATAPQGNFNSATQGEGNQSFVGLFGQTHWLPIDALELTLSGRFDSWRNADRLNRRTTAAGASFGGPAPDSDKTAFNPSLAARLELNDATSLRAVVYKSFRTPGFNNTTRTFGTGSSTTIANPDLGPERLTGGEAGIDYRHDSVTLGATWFLYRIKDMIATYTVNANASAPALVQTFCGPIAAGRFSNCGNATSVRFYTNDQDGESHGIELVADWKVSNTLTLGANYTRTETYLTRRGSVVTDPLGVQLTATPKDVAMLSASWTPMERLRTYAEIRYIGPMMVDTTSSNSTLRARQGGNAVVNLSASYAWDARTDLFINAVNVFDHAYSENAYTYNQPYNRTLSSPVAVNAGVRVRF